MFVLTLGISNGVLDRIMKDSTRLVAPFEDKRGKRVPANKITDDSLGCIKSHISSFPHYVSHYSRAKSVNAEYLPQGLNLATMYRLYQNECVKKITVSVLRRQSTSRFLQVIQSEI